MKMKASARKRNHSAASANRHQLIWLKAEMAAAIS
jgi:hypothetical protein